MKDSHDIVRLADQAYLSIREEILRGRLRPGAPLSRRRLARELGMSVVPVADALRRLEEAGLVESRSRAGTRVRVPSESDVKNLYELREALESQSARLFTQRATAASDRSSGGMPSRSTCSSIASPRATATRISRSW